MEWSELQVELALDLLTEDDPYKMKIVQLTMLAGENLEWDTVCSNYRRQIDIQRPEWLDKVFPRNNTDWHHLYHLLLLSQVYGLPSDYSGKILEYGGGFGNMARLTKEIWPDVDYTILDLPTSLELQRRYLKDIDINLVESTVDKYDVFVSTWALSETDAENQKSISRHWFDAPMVMLAYQDDKIGEGFDSTPLQNMNGFMYVESLLEGNTYAFRV